MKRIISLLLCVLMCMSMVSMLSGCKKDAAKVDAFVIMTELLDGLFNPFYYTAANDGTIVSMTQISMIGAAYDEATGKISVAYGENEPVVAKDYEIVENDDGTVSYYFVLKNGIKYSDGHPLTMEDVLFNFYVYLDPVYTGSNTLYSTKIQGLDAYRTQTISSGSGSAGNKIAETAAEMAKARRDELVDLYMSLKDASSTGEVTHEEMLAAINSHSLTPGYISAISNNENDVTNAQLKADYEYALKLFKEELAGDFDSAQESFTDAPYDAADIDAYFDDPVFCFMFYEGYVGFNYVLGEDGKPDRTKIDASTIKKNYVANSKEEAIDYIYNDKTRTALNEVLKYWATAETLLTEYAAKATEVLLHANVSEDGKLKVENISGIVSLGHSAQAGETITINGTEYKIAADHNADGTVKNEGEHDVLKITIDGVDPKAIWNFSLTIAPQHYYGEGSKVGVDIANNQFGVEYASFDFMANVIQSTRNVKLPMGAGAYKATDASSSDTPDASGFYNSNIVYFKANNNFETVGAQLNNAQIPLVRYQVVSSNNAINALQTGTVHYITPSLTAANFDTLTGMEKDGFKKLTTDQLGYGYIGVNASKVTNLYLRRAIMCAMNTSLAIDYYRTGTASQVCWNMSKVSWAYPEGEYEKDNGKDYPQMGGWNQQDALDNIQKNMSLAGDYSQSDLKITFTIAGSTLEDHPTYKVFRDAAELLNSLGWEVSVVCDSNALTKISTGSLEVWAAAWSSSLDPDMYQVYHKDSSATSTKAWGYPYIKSNGSAEELEILDELADLIDAARETNNQADRAAMYQEAMGYILDLAVELPVYQRSVLYAFNTNVIDASSVPNSVNPYSSPLDRIWEIKFAN